MEYINTCYRHNYGNRKEVICDRLIVDADRVRLIQVVSHLLGNAIEFGKKGIISIDVTVDKKHENSDKVIVFVKDSGHGIDPERYSKLFSRFISMSFSGTGLGLNFKEHSISAR